MPGNVSLLSFGKWAKAGAASAMFGMSEKASGLVSAGPGAS